jgi:multiple sugar transport system permease protein
LIGIKGPGWIADPAWAKPSLVMMGVWGAGQQIVIYLAGLKDIPEVFYEAADIDGANPWQKLRHVTLPLITPVVLFNTIMSIIGSFQVFDQAYIMTDGGPANSTEMYALYLYRNAFQYFNMGLASAQAWILFAIILACTLLLMRSSERWVHYGGE